MHTNKLFFLTLSLILAPTLMCASSSSTSELTSTPFTPIAPAPCEQEIVDGMLDFIEHELGATYQIPKEPTQDESLRIWKHLTDIKSKYEEAVAHQKKFNADRQEYRVARIALLTKSIDDHKATYASFLKRKHSRRELVDYNKTYKPFQESLEKELTSLLSSENSKTRQLRAAEFQSYKDEALKELKASLPNFNFQEK